MNDFLLLWLSLSLSGALVALTLILLKPLLRRFSKTWQYYIWLFVILRLLIPISPDVSITGVLFQQAETHFAVEHTPAKELQESDPLVLSEVPNEPGLRNNSPQKAPTTASAFYFWLIAAMALLFRKVCGYMQLVKAVKKESKKIVDVQLLTALEMVSEEMGIRKRIPVYTNSLVRAPMLLGVIKPSIIVPAKEIPLSEFTYIFRHELTHYRRKDFLYKWLTEIAVCLHWFNPLAYWVRKQINRDCEFSCDEAVVSCLDHAERQTYGDTLLNSIQVNHWGKKDVVSLSLNEDGHLIQERLCAILKYKRKSKRIVLIAAALTSILLCGTVFAGAYTVKAVENANINQLAQSNSNTIQPDIKVTQTVVYENVGLRRSEGDEEFEYITNVRKNNTDKTIISCDRAMLAFDKDGNPLELDWWARDGEYLSYNYLWRHGGLTREVLPGQKDEQTGGWKLNAGSDPNVQKVAYVLFCDIEITFEGGTVWENPEYEKWRSTYEGKRIDVDALENYYPYEQEITF